MPVRSFLYSLLLCGCCLSSFSQPVPNPTDTSYVMELLRKGEAIETTQTTAALNSYRKAFDFARKINYTKGYFESIRLMAYLLNNLGRHDEARQMAQTALELAKKDTSKRNLAISYFALGNTALHTGRLLDAVQPLQQAARFLAQLGQRKNVAAIHQNLGMIYEEQKMYPKALEYYQKALAFNLTDTINRRSIAIDYLSIGNVLNKEEKVAQSRAYYLKARQYTDPAHDLDFLVSLYNNIGYQYSSEARYDSALYYQREALRLSRQLNNPRHELHELTTLAQTHSRMKHYRQAIGLLNEAHAIATRTRAGLDERRNIYREYAIATAGLHDYRAALDWTDRHSLADDSINNADTKTLLQDYELKLKQAENRQKLAEKQRQITQLEADKKRQFLWLLVAGLLVVGVGGVTLFGYLYYRQRQQTAATTLLAAQRERELGMMQSEIKGQQKERLRISKEMHDDLGASLTAIGLLSEVVKTRMGPNTTPEVEKISSISADMVTAMNEIIWSLNTRNDSLNGLIAYTRAYASEFIENTDLRLHTDVAQSPREITMRGADRRNVFLTVKEALNNVVKHAQATDVTLQIDPRPNHLAIEVRDNGRGFMPGERINVRNGLGNMQTRMSESGGRCEILSSPAGTTVNISYPYPVAAMDKNGQNTSNVV